MEHGGRAEFDENSIRNDEGSVIEQVEGGGVDSEVGNEIASMELEQDEMDKLLEGGEGETGVESTPKEQVRSAEEGKPAPATAEKVEIPEFVRGRVGKEFLAPLRREGEVTKGSGQWGHCHSSDMYRDEEGVRTDAYAGRVVSCESEEGKGAAGRR